MKKKIIIIISIIVIIIPLFIVLYPIITNNKYEKELFELIYQNTEYQDILYLNKDNNHYIIKTKDKLIVIDLNYEEKLSLNINELSESNLELVYRNDNLYYHEKVREEEKIVYNFYDVYTNELSYTTSLGGI